MMLTSTCVMFFSLWYANMHASRCVQTKISASVIRDLLDLRVITEQSSVHNQHQVLTNILIHMYMSVHKSGPVFLICNPSCGKYMYLYCASMYNVYYVHLYSRRKTVVHMYFTYCTVTFVLRDRLCQRATLTHTLNTM